MQEHLVARLTAGLSPDFVEVINESHLHASGKGANSHFKITLVSDAFNGKNLVARHRQVRQLLEADLGGVHALGLHTYTMAEWQERGYAAPDSPNCHGVGK